MKDQIDNPEESLRIIRGMIAKSRQSFNQNSFYFLLWGILMFIAGISEYLLLSFTDTPWFWIGYPVLGIIGGIVSAVYSSKQDKQLNGETFIDTMVSYVWLAYGVSLICLIVTAILVNVNPGTFVLLLTGLPTFLTGFVLKHLPLKIGGIIFWLSGIISIFATDLYVPLIFSTAIALGYLLPGISLLKTERQRNV